MENRNVPKAPASDPMDRFVGGIGEPISNRELLCARCANLKADAVAECQFYEQKPLAVLRGEKVCPEYVSQEQEEA